MLESIKKWLLKRAKKIVEDAEKDAAKDAASKPLLCFYHEVKKQLSDLKLKGRERKCGDVSCYLEYSGTEDNLYSYFSITCSTDDGNIFFNSFRIYFSASILSRDTSNHLVKKMYKMLMSKTDFVLIITKEELEKSDVKQKASKMVQKIIAAREDCKKWTATANDREKLLEKRNEAVRQFEEKIIDLNTQISVEKSKIKKEDDNILQQYAKILDE